MYSEKSCVTGKGSALPLGTMLKGRYCVKSVLGQGGFGITYSAVDMQEQNRVAVKELFPANYVYRNKDQRTVLIQQGQENSFHSMQERFVKEAKILISLNDKDGVIKLRHLFNENSTYYYVMELLEGETLGSRLKRCGAMSWDQLAPVLEGIIAALEQIHSAGLIHRDISPDNIFLTKQGARLIDFGSVKAFNGNRSFTVLLKHSFAPWEQYLTNGKQGPWTDVYALCVTAYYSLSGQLPPQATTRRVNDTLKPLETFCPTLSPDICRAIHTGMAVLPENRYQSVAELSRALFSGENVLCLRGNHAGRGWKLTPGSILRIGRILECEVLYPPTYPGVSRRQCTVYRTTEGRFLIRDDGSCYGTFLLTGSNLISMEPGKWYCADGTHFRFGRQEEYMIK